MGTKELLKQSFKFFEKNRFYRTNPAGVLSERVAYGKFNPSAGHHIVDPIIQDKKPHDLQTFSLMERCIREADSSRIGISERHLSFFEMLAFHIYGEYTKLPKKEATKLFYDFLIDVVGLSKDRLLVTILKGCKVENQTLNEEETQEIYDTWVELLGEQRIRRTIGRRNFFIAKIPGAAGGTGFEVYYKMAERKYIEIGSQVVPFYLSRPSESPQNYQRHYWRRYWLRKDFNGIRK